MFRDLSANIAENSSSIRIASHRIASSKPFKIAEILRIKFWRFSDNPFKIAKICDILIFWLYQSVFCILICCSQKRRPARAARWPRRRRGSTSPRSTPTRMRSRTVLLENDRVDRGTYEIVARDSDIFSAAQREV